MYGAVARLFMHDHDTAVEWATRAIQVPTSHYWANAVLVSALGHLQAGARAKEARNELLRRHPDFTCSFARERLFYLQQEEQIDHYIEGLEKAGVPV